MRLAILLNLPDKPTNICVSDRDIQWLLVDVFSVNRSTSQQKQGRQADLQSQKLSEILGFYLAIP